MIIALPDKGRAMICLFEILKIPSLIGEHACHALLQPAEFFLIGEKLQGLTILRPEGHHKGVAHLGAAGMMSAGYDLLGKYACLQGSNRLVGGFLLEGMGVHIEDE